MFRPHQMSVAAISISIVGSFLSSSSSYSTFSSTRSNAIGTHTTAAARIFHSMRFDCRSGSSGSGAAATGSGVPTLTKQQQLQHIAHARSAAANISAYINLHSSNVNVSKARIALQAWREIDELPEKYIEIADVDSVVKLLNGIGYFRTVWERGHEGPANPLPKRTAGSMRDPEEIAIPPDFYEMGAAKQTGQFRRTVSGDTVPRGGPGERHSGGGGSGFQRRGASAEGKAPINNTRPEKKKPSADVVGEMIE